MMFIIVSLYILCWAPIKILVLLIEFQLISNCNADQYHILVYVYIIFHWLAMANSFVNPIVYSFMSKSFRVGGP